MPPLPTSGSRAPQPRLTQNVSHVRARGISTSETRSCHRELESASKIRALRRADPAFSMAARAWNGRDENRAFSGSGSRPEKKTTELRPNDNRVDEPVAFYNRNGDIKEPKLPARKRRSFVGGKIVKDNGRRRRRSFQIPSTKAPEKFQTLKSKEARRPGVWSLGLGALWSLELGVGAWCFVRHDRHGSARNTPKPLHLRLRSDRHAQVIETRKEPGRLHLLV